MSQCDAIGLDSSLENTPKIKDVKYQSTNLIMVRKREQEGIAAEKIEMPIISAHFSDACNASEGTALQNKSHL